MQLRQIFILLELAIIGHIQEYNVRASSISDKNHFIGRFATGLPILKKKNDNKWTLQKEGLQGRLVTDALRVLLLQNSWFNIIHQILASCLLLSMMRFLDLSCFCVVMGTHCMVVVHCFSTITTFTSSLISGSELSCCYTNSYNWIVFFFIWRKK